MVSRIVVLNDASTARGGATGLALESVRGFSRRSIPVTYITGDNGDNDELRELGVEVVALGQEHILKQSKLSALVGGVYNTSSKRMVVDWISSHDDPETVYHVHGWSKILSPSIFSALKAVRKRTFIHAHDFFLSCPNGGFMNYQTDQACSKRAMSLDCLLTHCDKRSYGQKLWRVGRQSSVSKALGELSNWAGILMIHERMESYFLSYGYPKERLNTVRNPALPFRRDRIAAEHNNAFFFVGRLEPEKGIEDIIAAARLVGVPLEVIGDGPLRESLQSAHPDLRFHGWKSRNEIGDLLLKGRALVMASRYPEPFGLVAAEASMSGLPVILSDTAFLAEEVEKTGIGFSVPPMQPELLGDVMVRVANLSVEELRAMSERAHTKQPGLATSDEEWIDRLLWLYEAAVHKITDFQPA